MPTQRFVDLRPGQTLQSGRYAVVRELGRGGMGATYFAQDVRAFRRPCVLKVMLPYFDPNNPQEYQAALQRFEREAKALAELGDHPNIPQLLDWFEENGQFVLVMEFVDGMDWDTKVKREGPQQPEQVIRWGIRLCQALEFLASKGYIHHDIKPANIILHRDSGEPILVDFGTVKAGRWAIKASFGTEGFAPPEQYNPPHQTEHRSDVYALGATLYYLLTGDHPAHHPFQFPKLSSLPPLLRDALRHALELDVKRRLTAKEFRERLERCLQPQSQVVAIAFVSRSGQKVTQPEELAIYADNYWTEAADHLMRGDVELWLKNIGRFDLAVKAETARQQFSRDPSAALQNFLEQLSAQHAPKPVAHFDPSHLDFGILEPGDSGTLPLHLTNNGRGYWFGSINTSHRWLSVTPNRFGCLPYETETFQVKVDGLKLPFRGFHRGQVIVQANDGVHTIPVRVRVSIARQLAEKFGRWVGALGGSLASGTLTALLTLIAIGALPTVEGARLVAASILLLLFAFKPSPIMLMTVIGGAVGGLGVWAAAQWLGVPASWLPIIVMAGAMFGTPYGKERGAPIGAWLGRRVGAMATTMLAALVAFSVLAFSAAAWSVLKQGKPLNEVMLTVAFLAAFTQVVSTFLGLLAFWLTVKWYRDNLPPLEAGVGLTGVTIFAVLAGLLWHLTVAGS